MDPLHITEFASKRYYEKLEQLPKDQQQTEQHQQHNENRAVDGASKFILPIRQAEHQGHEPSLRHTDHARSEKEKRGLFGRLRSSKSSVSVPESHAVRRPSLVSVPSTTSVGDSTTTKRRSVPFDQLFASLPAELQIQVIAQLPLSDVLNLRLASRAWHMTVTDNEKTIVRHQLEYEVPAYARRLYPITEASGYSLHYLCGLWHRLHVAAKLSGRMCDWCTKEIFLKTTKEQVAGFAAQRERMYRRLIPLLFTIFHFFETYQKLHIKYIQEHGHGVELTPYTLNPIEVQIMNMYDDRTLLKVHQVFPVVVASFCRQLRPPSYVGRLERTVRGYLREKPADEVNTAVLCLGGLRQVLRLWEVKSYNARIGTVESWYNEIKGVREHPRLLETSSNIVTKESKSRRGLMGLGRKKSTNLPARDAPGRGDDSPSRGSLDHHHRPPSRTSVHAVASTSLVFHTSMAAGMPMDRIDPEQARLLLADLPVLQRLWLSTAEALILDRRIVERSVDIKRNAQVMLDLIKEDGGAEEDIWWYGMATTESIRLPPLEAIEEDTIE